MSRLAISKEMVEEVANVLGINADVAEGSICGWQEGKGYIPEVLAKKFPRLALLWKSESVRAELASKVTLETVSDEQLMSVPEFGA